MHSDLNYYPKLYNNSHEFRIITCDFAPSFFIFSYFSYSKLVITLVVFSYSRVELKQFLPEIHVQSKDKIAIIIRK